MSWLRNFSLDFRQIRRRRLAAKIADPVLKSFYQNQHHRFGSPFRESSFLAADLEMTGLNPQTDHIVSIGFVPVINGDIHVGQARHILVASDLGMGQSATIHHIRDQDLSNAVNLRTAMELFLQSLTGKVLILHHAPLDMAFLSTAIGKLYNSKFQLPVVDTLQLEHRRLMRRQHPIQEGELRLFNCRRRYGLADATNHNALTDALATAELFLAITAHQGDPRRITLSDLVCK